MDAAVADATPLRSTGLQTKLGRATSKYLASWYSASRQSSRLLPEPISEKALPTPVHGRRPEAATRPTLQAERQVGRWHCRRFVGGLSQVRNQHPEGRSPP